jgi:hypothetical protein
LKFSTKAYTSTEKSKNSDYAILTLIPLGRLVEEEHDIFDVTYLKLLLDRMLSLKKA